MNAFVRRHARLFVAAGLFSLVLNLALLMPSLYMLQVYDRVLPTRSGETLVMLSLVAATALLLGVVLDAVRGRLLVLAGSLFDRDVGLRGLRRLLEGGAAVGADEAPTALRDVAVVRNFFAGPGLAALFDLVRELNRRIADRTMSTADAARARAFLHDLDEVLGILPDATDGASDLPAGAAELLEARIAARAGRDWAASDRLRDELLALGVAVEDTRDGQRWRRLEAVR